MCFSVSLKKVSSSNRLIYKMTKAQFAFNATTCEPRHRLSSEQKSFMDSVKFSQVSASKPIINL